MPVSSRNVGMTPENVLVTNPLSNVTSNPAQTGKGCEVPPLPAVWEDSSGNCGSVCPLQAPRAAARVTAVCLCPWLSQPCSPSNHHSSSTGLISSSARARCQAGGTIQEPRWDLCLQLPAQAHGEAAQSSPNPQRAVRAPLPRARSAPGAWGRRRRTPAPAHCQTYLGFSLLGAGSASGYSATPERFSSSQFI